MSNFKKGDNVKVQKSGMFDGFEGTIISLHAKVDLGQMGIWSFTFDELESLEKQIKDIIAKADTTMPVTKKTTDKSQKVKRPYNRKK